MKLHVSLNVRDVTVSIEFYSKLLGALPVKVRDDYAKFDMESPNLNLTLNQVPFSDGGSLSHLGLQVGSGEEVKAIAERWISAGLETLEQEEVECCYAVQDKVWAIDPDGNRWEVFVVLSDVPEERSSDTDCCAPGSNLVGISRSN
jgi:catechol 2,3-dioxygenase-like lactoylglutathione lyase family enzyme